MIKEMIKRYIVFFAGLFISSLGVSFITKANLGTSPISSIPYVLSVRFQPTIGEFTILFSLLLIILQILILKRRFKLIDLLQVPVSVAFGYFIDLTMGMLWWMDPQSYIMQAVFLLIGYVILGFGVYLEMLGNVIMLPGESFVRAVVIRWNRNFGNVKVCFDASMTICAGLLSVIFFSQLQGVREGTIIAAVTVGLIAKFFDKVFSFVKPMVYSFSYVESCTEKIAG